MRARRRITACWLQSWPRADSPAGPTCWNARRVSRARTARLRSRRSLVDPGPDGYLRANLFKYHAACYLTHAPIEAARRLRLEHDLTPERIVRIVVRIDNAADRICNIAEPRTGLEAKFSLRQTVAMALSGVETGALASYSERLTSDPRLAALRERDGIDFQIGLAASACRDRPASDRRHAPARQARRRRACGGPCRPGAPAGGEVSRSCRAGAGRDAGRRHRRPGRALRNAVGGRNADVAVRRCLSFAGDGRVPASMSGLGGKRLYLPPAPAAGLGGQRTFEPAKSGLP